MCLIQSPCWARYPNFAESLLRSAESNPALFVPRCSSRFIQKLLVWSRKPNSKFNFSPDQSTCLSLADSSPIYLDIHQFARSHKKKSFPHRTNGFCSAFQNVHSIYAIYIYIYICATKKRPKKVLVFVRTPSGRALLPDLRETAKAELHSVESMEDPRTTWEQRGDGKMWWWNDVKCGKTGKTMKNDCEV